MQGWAHPETERDILARSEDTNPEQDEHETKGHGTIGNEGLPSHELRKPRPNIPDTKRTRHEQNTDRMDTNHRNTERTILENVNTWFEVFGLGKSGWALPAPRATWAGP